MNPLAGKKILVVDDEPDVVAYLTGFLEDNEISVISAANGKEGFAKAKSEIPALIILDVSMPEESGVRMYRELYEHAETKHIPVIMLTGVSHDFKRFIETRKQVPPPAGYFDKPADLNKLLEKMTEVLNPAVV